MGWEIADWIPDWAVPVMILVIGVIGIDILYRIFVRGI